jgi:membrane fusion protein (multidrug efflux system)
VTLAPVLAMDLVDRIEATGQLLAKEHAKIAAEVGGRITEVLIDEGAWVETGAGVLAIDPERRSLERDSARARVEEARENLREQEREHRRMRDLRASKVASQTRLDQAETDLKLAKSRLLAAEAQFGVVERALRDATVTAPFSGLIARRTVSRGEFVAPGQELFELVSLDPIEVEFHVTEVDSGRVALEQMVGVRVAPFPDETFGATVTFVSPTIDTRTRTLRVKAQLENSEGRLRPGLFARVDLGISAREGVLMVLEEAILRRADGAVVFRANGENRVERIVIETGVYHEGYVEVVKGLVPGDTIVSRGQARLVEGQRVVPRNPDGTLLGRPMPDVAEAPESQR